MLIRFNGVLQKPAKTTGLQPALLRMTARVLHTPVEVAPSKARNTNTGSPVFNCDYQRSRALLFKGQVCFSLLDSFMCINLFIDFTVPFFLLYSWICLLFTYVFDISEVCYVFTVQAVLFPVPHIFLSVLIWPWQQRLHLCQKKSVEVKQSL